jgi:hypothetical protein
MHDQVVLVRKTCIAAKVTSDPDDFQMDWPNVKRKAGKISAETVRMIRGFHAKG